MNSDIEAQVRERLDQLTKPPGSLGRLEEIVVQLASMTGNARPGVARKGMYVFCGDHGVTAEGVSPYPSVVTREMMRNFVRGGAAISVLCRSAGIETVIVDAGLNGEPVPGVLDKRIGSGTRNIAVEPAMTRAEAERCIEAGRELAADAAARFDIVGLGEMGIGNTTPASAILAIVTGADPIETTGAGTGSDPARILRKAEVIRSAISLHRPDPSDALSVLAAAGGFEIGMIAGFIAGAAEHRLPIVLDGFPCCSAALLARLLSKDACATSFFAHRSAEKGHRLMLELLGAQPLLDLGMRLGEGTGAALAIGIIEAAVQLYNSMATFGEAAVSGAEEQRVSMGR